MLKRAVADTGPLVAAIRAREAEHETCLAALKTLRRPLINCWPVLTEAAWLLRTEPGGIKALGQLVHSGTVALMDLDDAALRWMIAFMERYASVGAQLADAALMYIAETQGIDTVFTLDRRDFSVYRTMSGQALTIVPEFS